MSEKWSRTKKITIRKQTLDAFQRIFNTTETNSKININNSTYRYNLYNTVPCCDTKTLFRLIWFSEFKHKFSMIDFKQPWLNSLLLENHIRIHSMTSIQMLNLLWKSVLNSDEKQLNFIAAECKHCEQLNRKYHERVRHIGRMKCSGFSPR